MRNWDPLSVFRYLTGAPTVHLTFFILMQRNINRGTLDKTIPGPNGTMMHPRNLFKYNGMLFDSKEGLVYYMMYSHLVCFILGFVF